MRNEKKGSGKYKAILTEAVLRDAKAAPFFNAAV
jgi:hypothetical protein